MRIIRKQRLDRFARLGLKEAPRSQATQIEEASRRLAKDLVITPVKKANIIEVKYTSRSPEKAAAVLRKVQDLYLEKHLKLHRPPGTYEFFKTQADQAEGQLAGSGKATFGFSAVDECCFADAAKRSDRAEAH